MFRTKKNIFFEKMGYCEDQEGIMERFIREKKGWEPHLENSKKFIVSSAENKKHGTAVVLGSGWLLDVPAEELCKIFTTVYLVDITHPKWVINKMSAKKEIIILHADITGGLAEMCFNIVEGFKKNRKKTPLSSLCPVFPDVIAKADFVVSLNLLNQLNILIVDYLKIFEIYTEQELSEFRKIIQHNHIDLLPRGKSCLITDFEEELVNKKNEVIKTNPLVFVDLPGGTNRAQWKWMFDTTMTYYENYKTIFNVVAVDF